MMPTFLTLWAAQHKHHTTKSHTAHSASFRGCGKGEPRDQLASRAWRSPVLSQPSRRRSFLRLTTTATEFCSLFKISLQWLGFTTLALKTDFKLWCVWYQLLANPQYKSNPNPALILSPTDIRNRPERNKHSQQTGTVILSARSTKWNLRPQPLARKHTPTSLPKYAERDAELKSDGSQYKL